MSNTLLISFAIRLERDDLLSWHNHNGPLFHRWLPDGEQDAIEFTEPKFGDIIKLWFKRFGSSEKGGYIVFDVTKKEVKPDIVLRQAVLQAGPLFGSIRIKVSPEELDAIRKDQRNDPSYKAVGKRIVQELIPNHVIRFIKILKFTYGQYWIKLPGTWNSQEQSLGSYCRNWNMRWSEDNGQNWLNFAPTKGAYTTTIGVDHSAGQYKAFLQKQDWLQLETLTREGYEPSFAASIVSKAHELSDQNKLRHAFIEAVTAIEASIEEFYRSKIKSNKTFKKSFQSYDKLPLPTKLLTLIVTISPNAISEGELQSALEAIEVRNEIVHEGVEPKNEDKQKLLALLKVASALLTGPNLRFPSALHGQELRKSAEDWDREDPPAKITSVITVNEGED